MMDELLKKQINEFHIEEVTTLPKFVIPNMAIATVAVAGAVATASAGLAAGGLFGLGILCAGATLGMNADKIIKSVPENQRDLSNITDGLPAKIHYEDKVKDDEYESEEKPVSRSSVTRHWTKTSTLSSAYTDTIDFENSFTLGKKINRKEKTPSKNVIGTSSSDFREALREAINHKEKTLYDYIIMYCEQKHFVKESDLYKKACVNAKTFAKIRNDETPSKLTLLRICLALELSLLQTQEMLNVAGYSLSNNNIIDKIIAFCLDKEVLNIDRIEDYIFEMTGQSYLIPNEI